MARIVVHEFITLDGVIEAPSWTFDYPLAPRMGAAIGAIMGASKAILLGRRTYEQFAPAWSSRTAEDDPGAPFMNATPKFVVSGTLKSADWHNSTILGRYDAAAIRSLKDGIDGDIYVSGSGTLVRAMLADELVDELHLFVFPLALGAGGRLFADNDEGSPTKLTLGGAEAYENGVVHLTYQLAETDGSRQTRITATEADIAPWMLVVDGQRAIDFYRAAFGAVERYKLEDGGRVVVARLLVGEAGFWLQEDRSFTPQSGTEGVRMILTVDDPQFVHAQALAAGASEIRAVFEDHGWLTGRLADPFGHQWEVGRPTSDWER